MRALIALCLFALSVSACTTPMREHRFEANDAGLRAAADRMLNQPEGSQASLMASLTGEPVEGRQARFRALRWVRLNTQDPDSDTFYNPQICREAGLSADCDARSVFEHVYVYARVDHAWVIEEFPADMSGALKALQVAEDGPRHSRAVVVLRQAPAAPSYNVRYVWAGGGAFVLHPDFLCTRYELDSCVTRADIRRVAVRPPLVYGQGRSPATFVEPVGDDLTVVLARARAHIEREGGGLMIEIKREFGGPSYPNALIQSVDVIEVDRFCGQMTISWISADTETCLTFAEIRDFTVNDRMRDSGEIVTDTLLLPFRFLGAVGQATAMGGAGG